MKDISQRQDPTSDPARIADQYQTLSDIAAYLPCNAYSNLLLEAWWLKVAVLQYCCKLDHDAVLARTVAKRMRGAKHCIDSDCHDCANQHCGIILEANRT